MVPSGLIFCMLSPTLALLEPPSLASLVDAPLEASLSVVAAVLTAAAGAAGASVSGLAEADAEADAPVAALGSVTCGERDEPTEVIDMASPPEEILTTTLANRSPEIA